MHATNVVFGLEGTSLNESERSFFQSVSPFGFVLFARNIDTPSQVLSLTASLRYLSGRDDIPILIDQEGGKVQRLRAPRFKESVPAATIGNLALKDPDHGARAAYLHAYTTGRQLQSLGINVDCAPCLDLFFDGASSVIGNRAYGSDPALVGTLGRESVKGFLDAGCMPVIKHLPGHGRAKVDSHHSLPVIDAPLETLLETDFLPFSMCTEGCWGMTAHLVVTDVDADRPITQSAIGIRHIIRNKIGFQGPLMSDDLSMNALTGNMEYRAERALSAGCDLVLHCNGKMEEMDSVADACSPLSSETIERLSKAPIPKTISDLDLKEAERELASLLS